jgi:NAD(P)-dependent dehydrogenase (short-subunit alcohol dehydrogenase family)
MANDAEAQPVEPDPRERGFKDGFPEQELEQPGLTPEMKGPKPDHGEETYVGSAKLEGRKALITGGDSGIGRAVAIAFAREGADVAISYQPEEQVDAEETKSWIEKAGRKCLLLPGDLREEQYCSDIVASTVQEFGGLDIVVLNAAFQDVHDGIENLETAKMDRTFKTNLYGHMWVTRNAVPHLQPGASIITTTSIQATNPSPQLLDYAMTKAALVAFTQGLAQELAEKGVRVNSVAPGPIWTPLIPATSWPDKLPSFGQDVPLERAGQPAELAAAYVFLASREASYIAGAVIPVTGGKPF